MYPPLILVAFLLAFSATARCSGNDSYEQLFHDAAALSAKRDYAGAARKYEAALRLRPGAPEAMSNAGVVYYMAGRYDEAAAILEQALRVQPDLVSANLIRGLALVRLGRFAQAAAPLERVLTVSPGQRDAILGLASARVGLGDLQRASVTYRNYLHTNPRDADAWHGLAVCYEKLAQAESRKLVSMRGGTAYAKRFVGEYWLERGQQRLAEEALSEAYVADPDQPGLAALLHSFRASDIPAITPPPHASTAAAKVYLEAKRFAALSREAFESFVDMAPESWQAQLFLGDVSRQRRKFEEAIRHYTNAARLKPDSSGPLIGLGTVYWELAQDEQATAFLTKARELAPDTPHVLFALGNIAVRQRKDSEAVAVLRECIRVSPEHAGAHADLGKAYMHLNEPVKALPHLQRAVAIDTYGDIHYQLGQALRKAGREPEAVQAIERSKGIRRQQLEREQRLRLGNN